MEETLCMTVTGVRRLLALRTRAAREGLRSGQTQARRVHPSSHGTTPTSALHNRLRRAPTGPKMVISGGCAVTRSGAPWRPRNRTQGAVMSNVSVRRVAGATAIVGGVVALVGNALAPRFNDDDVVVYRKIAHSTRFTVADVIVLLAVLLITAALVGFARSAGSSEFAYYGRLAAIV